LVRRISFKDCLGKKTLILGDVGTGKTKMTLDLLKQAIAMGHAQDMTVVDMAPEARVVSGRRIGGRLSQLMTLPEAVRYLCPPWIETPRLSAKNAEELISLAKRNREVLEPLLQRFLRSPSAILFVNDISISLQSGSMELVMDVVKASRTLVANGYYGKYLSFDFGTGFSKAERDRMDLLAQMMDVMIGL
jgi:archaellum biogenesis ATPase FlaH